MWDPDDAGAPLSSSERIPARRHRCIAGTQLLQPGRVLLQEEGVLRETHHRVSLSVCVNFIPQEILRGCFTLLCLSPEC